jgi:hypothetical protein
LSAPYVDSHAPHNLVLCSRGGSPQGALTCSDQRNTAFAQRRAAGLGLGAVTIAVLTLALVMRVEHRRGRAAHTQPGTNV